MRHINTLLPALALCGITATIHPAAAQPVYIALGDSVAYGYTDTLNVSFGDQGYVAPFAAFLGDTFYGGVAPKVDNLAISGETTSEFLGLTPPPLAVAANLNYSTPLVGPGGTMTSESAAFFQAVANEQAQGNTIADVTFSIGADDAFAALGSGTSISTGDIDTLTKTVGLGEASFLSQLRTVLPTTPVLLLNYYNPFTTFAAPATVNEATSNSLSGLASYANVDDTALQTKLAAQYDATFVDISGLPPADTYDANPDTNPGFPDGVHPTAAGYQYIAHQLDQAAVPEPGAWALLALGLPVVVLAARRRKA